MIGSAGIKVTLFFTRPQYQQPNTGRMLPVNIVGTVVYVTKGENAALAHAVPAGLIVGTIGIFLWARIKRDVLANSSVDQ